MIADRRTNGLRVLLIVLLLLLQAPVGRTTASRTLAQREPATTSDPIVITAQIEPLEFNPSGDQVLRLAGPVQGPKTLDPAMSRDLSSAFLIRQLYRGLTRLGPDLQPVPELADRIEISADRLEYVFHLRDGVTFHDGRAIHASDVVHTFTRALDPATAGGEAAILGGPTFLSDIDGADDMISGRATSLRGVEAVDERTVRVRLSAPRATFLMKLAAAPASIVDAQETSSGGEWWKTPNGSGPFQVAEWLAEDHMTLTRFDEFFAGAPALQRIEIALGANALQSYNLFQAGEIDIDTLNINALDRVMAAESRSRDEVSVTPLFAVDYIAFRTDAPPMDDPLIRRAVQLGFPRAKVANVTYEGYTSEASGLIPHGMLGQDWPVEGSPYDLEAARAAISQSSYESADQVPPIQIYVAGGGAAESLRDDVSETLGLTVEVISVNWPEFVDGLSRRSYPAYELYWGADYPDPESFLWTLFGSTSADNYIDYENAAMDDLLRQAAAEPDTTRRADLYAQAQQILMDDLVVIPLYYDVAYTISKSYVKGLNVTSLGILRLETVWLEH